MSNQPSETSLLGACWPGSLWVCVASQWLQLLPSKAVFWPAGKTLFVADTHWGKAASLRRSGVFVPPGGTTDDLARLSRSLEATEAQRLVVLGDLLHARSGRQQTLLQQVMDWRARHASLQMVTIRGNHDRGAGDPPSCWQMEIVDEPLLEPPFVLRHIPTPTPDGYVLAGHIHPLVRLDGLGADRLRLPCFHFTDHVGTLPAFSSLTAGAEIRPAAGDQIYLIVDEEVVEAPR